MRRHLRSSREQGFRWRPVGGRVGDTRRARPRCITETPLQSAAVQYGRMGRGQRPAPAAFRDCPKWRRRFEPALGGDSFKKRAQ